VDSGRGGYSSSAGMYGGGASNGSPSTVSLDAHTMLVMPARRAALTTFQVQLNRPGFVGGCVVYAASRLGVSVLACR
jgi:hypothetical protein